LGATGSADAGADRAIPRAQARARFKVLVMAFLVVY
jgi:hypothetical protein